MTNPGSKRFSILTKRGQSILWLLLVLLSGMILSGGQPVAADGWVVECVDCPRYFSDLTNRSLRLDDAGRPRVAYGGDHLYYAWHDGNEWHSQVVDAEARVGQDASLALDWRGDAHIGYAGHTGVRYAYQDPTSGAWQVEIVDGASDGVYTSLALRFIGQPHIAYQGSGSLKYAYRDQAGWHVEVVDSDYGSYQDISLAVDRVNRPHVSYYWGQDIDYNWDIRYAYRDESGWHVQVMDETPGSYGGKTSLALDAYDRPHISYIGLTDNGYQLRYAFDAGSGWVRQPVDKDVFEDEGYSSLALDAAGRPRISYYDHSLRSLVYANRDSGSWETEPVDSDVSCTYPSLAVDSGGVAHIAYFHTNGYLLEHAVQAGAEWQIETIDRAGIAGWAHSLKLDGQQVPHIGYVVSGQDEFRYAAKTGGSQVGGGWVTERVAGAGARGYYTSLAVDDAGWAHMAYYYQRPDVSTRKLEYAYRDATGWHVEGAGSGYYYGCLSLVLAPDGQPRLGYSTGIGVIKYAWRTTSGWQSQSVWYSEGTDVSLALTAAGQPRLAYYNWFTNEVMFAYNDGTDWYVETVDADVAENDGCVSLALDASGNPHISYFGNLPNEPALKHAFKDGAGWHVETVDAEAGYGWTSIAVAADGVPRIAYSCAVDIYHGELRYAKRQAGGWLVETVPTGGGDASTVSLALDGNDLPHIGFYDSSTLDLKYAHYIVMHSIYLPLMTR